VRDKPPFEFPHSLRRSAETPPRQDFGATRLPRRQLRFFLFLAQSHR
jgi:hypothetical protein